jgi:hypothetical protein
MTLVVHADFVLHVWWESLGEHNETTVRAHLTHNVWQGWKLKNRLKLRFY